MGVNDIKRKPLFRVGGLTCGAGVIFFKSKVLSARQTRTQKAS